MLRRLVAPLAAAVVLVPASGFAQTAAWRLPSSTGLYKVPMTRRCRTTMRGALPTIRDTATVSRKARRTAAGDRFNYQDERAFQRADRGYHRSFGDRERCRQIFRDGYAAGYSEAFGRNSRVPRNDGWYRPTPV